MRIVYNMCVLPDRANGRTAVYGTANSSSNLGPAISFLKNSWV